MSRTPNTRTNEGLFENRGAMFRPRRRSRPRPRFHPVSRTTTRTRTRTIGGSF